MGRIGAGLLALTLCGCQTAQPTIEPKGATPFCDVAKVMTHAVIDTPATQAEIAAYNAYGKEHCGWKL